MIRLDGAGVRFGDRWVFRGLTLEVRPGTCMALLGPNGRGKTTMIKAALGLQKLSEGNREAPPIVGYVPQASSGMLRYPALEMVVMGRASQLGRFRSPGPADYRIARDALEAVGITPLAAQPFATLSGGEKQLVLLARAIATGAKAIVLDEPAAALDLANQARFLSILDRLRGQGGYAVLFSTHLPQHALHIADQTLMMMREGDYLCGPTDEILSEPALARLYGLPVRRIALEEAGQTVRSAIPVFNAPGTPFETTEETTI